MSNLSIRTRILAGLVIVNLLGAVFVLIYLHQSVSGSLDVWAQQSLKVGLGSWQNAAQSNTWTLANLTNPKDVQAQLDKMKAISGADYALLVDKSALNQTQYSKERQAANLPNNWDERQNYVLAGSTNSDLTDKKAQFNTAAADVPEIGKVVGVENGACTALCHSRFKKPGDYWVISWSTDSNSRAHAVFPVNDSQGKPVGVVYSIQNISEQANAARDSVYRTMIVIALTLLVATLAIGGMLDVLIFRRLFKMITSMEDISVRVAGGDFDAHFVSDGTTDEIGRFEDFFSRFLDLVTMTLKSLIK